MCSAMGGIKMKEGPDVAQPVIGRAFGATRWLIMATLAADPPQTAATRILPVRRERRFTWSMKARSFGIICRLPG